MLCFASFDMISSNLAINTRDTNDRRAHLDIVHGSVTIKINPNGLKIVQNGNKLDGIKTRDEILFVKPKSEFAHSGGWTNLFIVFERASEDKQLIVFIKTFNLNVSIDNVLIWICSNCVVNSC